jgi:hypothetical protein
MKRFFSKLKWSNTERVLRFLEVTAIIVGVVFTMVQIRDVRNMQSAQLMLDFNNQLNSDTNSKIITAIENNQPIFKENSGNFTSTDVDKYLSVYELLYDTYDAGLITGSMLYSGFSYDIIKTYDNQEIQAYLKKVMVDNKDIFAGFKVLAQSLKLSEKN